LQYGQTHPQDTEFFAAGTSQHPTAGGRGNSQIESRGGFGTRGGNHHKLPQFKPKLECSHFISRGLRGNNHTIDECRNFEREERIKNL
jgi:hypothetical protein